MSDIDAANFGCACKGCGFLVMESLGETEEAKCNQCEQWRHQEKSERIMSVADMEARGWTLMEGQEIP